MLGLKQGLNGGCAIHSSSSWDAGMILNHLGFYLTQAWLLPRPVLDDVVNRILDELELTVLELGESADARERLQEKAAEIRSDWDESFDSEWHHNTLLEAGSEIQSRLSCVDTDQLREEVCERLLAPWNSLLEEVNKEIKSNLNDKQREVYKLASIVDRGLRPPEIYTEMFPPDEVQERKSPFDSLGPLRELGVSLDTAASNVRDRAWHLPTCSRKVTSRPLQLQWYREVQQRCQQLGIEVELSQASTVPNSAGPAENAEQTVERIASAIRADLHRLSSESLTDADMASASPQATNTSPSRVEAIAASNPITRNCSTPDVLHMTTEEIERLREIKKEIDPENTYIGESPAILKVFEDIQIFNKDTKDPVLILGPTGVGKTKIAELIHSSSDREDKPYKHTQVTADRGSDNRFLYGQWVGYGPGHGVADVPKEGRPGYIQDCEGGTIFIDELVEASEDFQVFLLQIPGQKEPIRRLGKDDAGIIPNVRLLLATNVSLEELRSRLRPDLLERIRTQILTIPPLSERLDDIFLLVNHFAPHHTPTDEFLLALLHHSWPGNVRELKQTVTLATKKAKSKKKTKNKEKAKRRGEGQRRGAYARYS